MGLPPNLQCASLASPSVNLLHAAALKDGLEIVSECIEIEFAKTAGCKQFAEMVSFFKRNRISAHCWLNRPTGCTAIKGTP
jgi:hypothetical protein